MDLLDTEIRALGCLIEKQRTTPDAYPLTLNSLRLACNQATNRDPVVAYEESDLRDALHRLERRGLVRFASGAGSRAAKYRHLLAERLPMDDAEQALMCVLMLRGPQTPGECKQRADRMHAFASLAEVQDALARLIERELVIRLPRRPGQKEERYGHLLGADAEGLGEAPAVAAGPAHDSPSRAPAPGDMPRERPTAPVSADLSSGRPTAAVSADLSSGRPTAPVSADLSSGRPTAPVSAGSPPETPAVPAAAEPAAAQEPSLRPELERLRERVTILERELGDLKADLGVGVRE